MLAVCKVDVHLFQKSRLSLGENALLVFLLLLLEVFYDCVLILVSGVNVNDLLNRLIPFYNRKRYVRGRDDFHV